MDEKLNADYYALYGPGFGYPKSPEISEVELLLSEFEAHEAQERGFVQKYKEFAETSKNPLITFLLRLIISDEEKHHAVTHAMVSTLRGSLTWRKPEDGLEGFSEMGEGNDQLLALTEDFIKVEREGIKEYKRLVKASKGYYQGLFALLLMAMIRDSEKHVEILEFLRQKLKEA